jgi:hypothetical protein
MVILDRRYHFPSQLAGLKVLLCDAVKRLRKTDRTISFELKLGHYKFVNFSQGRKEQSFKRADNFFKIIAIIGPRGGDS